MASTISAGTTAGTAVSVSGDTTGNLAFQTNGTTTAMTIDTSQNVGIGTTSPNARLHAVSAAGTVQVKWSDATNGTANLDTASGLSRIWTNVGLAFGAGAETFSERMRIDSSGRLLVGTTATTTSSSQSGEVYSTGSVGFMYTNTTAANFALSVKNEGTSGTRSLIRFYEGTGGGTARGSITTDGATVAYNTTSDYRLKENIAPMTGALAKIAQLKPCTYTWKEDGTDGQGFIAHELQAVVPDCVTGEKDAVDEDGNIKPQGVDTSFLVATLTSAIQELKAELDTQATKIAELEAKLEGTE